MSSCDKIIEVLKENPATSSKTIWEKIGKEISHRQLQRQLKELHVEGLLETHTIGRDVVYTLKTNPSGINAYFINKFWTEFFLVNEILHDYNRGGPVKAFTYLHSLIAMLPKDLKDELEPHFEKIKANQDKHQALCHFINYLGDKENPSVRDQELDNQRIMVDLMDKVANVVHNKIKSSS